MISGVNMMLFLCYYAYPVQLHIVISADQPIQVENRLGFGPGGGTRKIFGGSVPLGL